MTDFTLLIQEWYRQNSRDLPWRNTKNVYKIWISEIVLQQTRVNQGVSYYNKLLKNFPDVQTLAAADEQEILKHWQGLGYYSRARNLHKAAQQIVDDFKGEFPKDYDGIKSLKGIGDYTASAIASFAFDLPYAVLDGNVYRVLSRFFNEYIPIDTGEGKRVFQNYANQLLDKQSPAIHNQAIMELGALVCKPKNPDCSNCPVNEICLAYRKGTPTDLPIKSRKVKVRKRYFHYFTFLNDTVQLEQRNDEDIWGNMFQLPMIEVDKKMTKVEIMVEVNKKYPFRLKRKIHTQKHILTHQHIDATFWEINEPFMSEDFVEVNFENLNNYPLPRLIDRFFEEHRILFVNQ